MLIFTEKEAIWIKTKEKTVKAKIRFVKFEKGLAMQVLEMDERFRAECGLCNNCDCYGKMIISSSTYPSISIVNVIHLRGCDRKEDFKIALKEFENNSERDEYLAKAIEALQSWAGNWEGFNRIPSETANVLDFDDDENDFILKV